MRYAVLILAPILCSVYAWPQTIEPLQIKRPAQIGDLFTWREISELSISPDGRAVAYVVGEVPEEKNKRTSDLWLIATDAQPSAATRITRHPANDTFPRWSPDARRLAFLSSRDSTEEDEQTAQIYLYSLSGGEPEKLTGMETGVTQFAWSPDGGTIYFLSPDPPSEEKKARLEKQQEDDAEPVEREFEYSHLWALDLATRRTRRLSRGEFHITDFTPSPSGQQIAFCAAPTPLLNYETATELYVMDLAGGTRRRLTNNNVAETQPRWSPDGRWITFAANANQDGTMHYIALSRLFAVPSAGGTTTPLMGDFEVGLVVEIGLHFWSPEGRSVWLMLDQGFSHQLVELAVEERDGVLKPGEQRLHYRGERVMSLIDRSANGSRLAFGLEGPQLARDVYVADRENVSAARRLTAINPELDTLRMANSELVQWKSTDGQQVEGLLYYPLDYQKGQRVPLLVNIHGGPLAAEKNAFLMDMYTYPHITAAHGYATLFVNYRGSTGYGDDFARAIVGAYYTKDVDDIRTGVDAMIARGVADPQRLGIQGWSNGGILTAWITTATDRFKAASVGAADVNWISDFGTADIAVPFDTSYFRGPPWQQRQHYLEKSPLLRMDRVKTPTLILHGEADVRVPTGQGFEHFRALKEIGKTKVEMILFPREEHTLSEITHQKTKVERELAWFDEHMLGLENRPEPLAAPLLPRVAQTGGLYGRLVSGVLVPETLPLPVLKDTPEDGDQQQPPLEAARFEVTNAQYQYFLIDQPMVAVPAASQPLAAAAVWDPARRRFKPGYANHPVVGMTPREAAEYCRWLSTKTGRKFRLPTSQEWRSIAGGGRERQFPWGDEFETSKANDASRWGERTVFDADEFFASDMGRKLLARRLPTLQVGTLEPDAAQLYDQSGNAWELVSDTARFAAHGGGWSSTPSQLRLEASLAISPGERRNDVGFRVVVER